MAMGSLLSSAPTPPAATSRLSRYTDADQEVQVFGAAVVILEVFVHHPPFSIQRPAKPHKRPDG